MAYVAKDGKAFGNREMGQHYDRTRPKEKPPSSEGEDREKEMGGEGESETPMHEIIAEHGPAHTTTIKRHEDGHHSVTSHHEDGHKHTSHKNADGEHHDVHSAHAHSMHAHTGEEQTKAFAGQETPEEEEAEETAPAIPGMRG